MWRSLLKVARFAKKAHSGQYRMHSTPYFDHPKMVARILWNEGHKNLDLISAAYTHDILEESPQYRDELQAILSPPAYRLVLAVTRDKKESLDQFYARIKSSGEDAVHLKIADRTHNNSDLQNIPGSHPIKAKAKLKTDKMNAAFGSKIKY